MSDAPMSDGAGTLADVGRRPVKRALISVYDKTGLDELAHALAGAGAEIVSTGSTAAHIESLGLPVTRVEQLTGFPECLDGRVKTLHPKVHAGLLADLRLDSHAQQLTELGIEPFDLLVSNLYPFTETVASGADFDDCIEKIDIGGPAMVRSAAKNHANVAVVTSPDTYPDVIKAVEGGGLTLAQRRALAARAFADIAAYDVAIAEWFAVQEATAAGEWWPAFGGIATTLETTLRYGENPHQQAALYLDAFRVRPASRRRRSCRARRCPTTTTSTATPPGAARTTSPSRASPSSSTRIRAGSRSARMSPRPTARHTRATRNPPTAA